MLQRHGKRRSQWRPQAGFAGGEQQGTELDEGFQICGDESAGLGLSRGAAGKERDGEPPFVCRPAALAHAPQSLSNDPKRKTVFQKHKLIGDALLDYCQCLAIARFHETPLTFPSRR
jgi:hypothetical protein